MKNGSSAEKVDILILGDGYSKADTEKFRVDFDPVCSGAIERVIDLYT